MPKVRITKEERKYSGVNSFVETPVGVIVQINAGGREIKRVNHFTPLEVTVEYENGTEETYKYG